VSCRRRGAGSAGLEVGEDGCDHARIGDDGEHPQGCTAARAAADVDVENAAQTLRPCHLSASAGRPRLGGLARRGSLLITTNKRIQDWPELLAGDEVLATTILDRLLHHSHVLNIKGRSYRLRDLEQAVSLRR